MAMADSPSINVVAEQNFSTYSMPTPMNLSQADALKTKMMCAANKGHNYELCRMKRVSFEPQMYLHTITPSWI